MKKLQEIHFHFARINADSTTLVFGDGNIVTLVCVGSFPRFTFLISDHFVAGTKPGIQADIPETFYVQRPLLALGSGM